MTKTLEDLVREVVMSAPAKVRIEGLTVEERWARAMNHSPHAPLLSSERRER